MSSSEYKLLCRVLEQSTNYVDDLACNHVLNEIWEKVIKSASQKVDRERLLKELLG